MPSDRSECKSEVARLRQQIEEQCQAMQNGLNGYAVTARHDFIAHRFQQIDAYREQLVQLIGEPAANELVITTYEDIIT